MKSLIPIVEIANTICEDVEDLTKKHQPFVLKQLARCFQNLNIFMTTFTTVKTEVFTLNNAIEMPPDFIYETKVGVMVHGKLVLIGKNYDQVGNIANDMNQTEFDRYLTTTLNGDDRDADVTPFYNYKGDLVLGAYGAGGKCDGLYDVDTVNGRIILGSNIPCGSEIVIEYKSDGVSNGLNLVPIEMEETLYNYGMWKYYFKRNDPRYRQSEADYDTAYYQLESLYRFQPINYTSKLYNTDKGTINDLI